MRFESLQDWLQWLETCHPTEIELGLDRVNSVWLKLGCSFQGKPVITVAGTNGKGSCVATLAHLLKASGYRVGAYTSPHLMQYNERICLDGKPAADADIVAAFARVDAARGEISLTYFEFGTLAALLLFAEQDLDVILLEVGLGGRLDAVNIVDADIAIISSIAVDHEAWLGSDREQIAREKAGIIRPGKPVICGELDPPASLQACVEEQGAVLYQRNKDFFIEACSEDDWSWRGLTADNRPLRLEPLPLPQLPIDNVATALQAIQLLDLPLSPGSYKELSSLQLAGRFQQLSCCGRAVVMDVAHNPAAARQLAERLQASKTAGRCLLLFALMADKDHQGIISALSPQVDKWYLADLKNVPRALAAGELAGYIQHAEQGPPGLFPDPQEALLSALSDMQEGDRLVVAGSFFLVAEIMQLIDSGVSLDE